MPVAFAIFSALAAIAAAIPFKSHYRTKNMAACILISWLIVNNICDLINCILWPDFDTIYQRWDGAIYCDIQSRINFTAGAGMTGALAAISRNLAKIMSDRSTAAYSRSEKRKSLCIDLALCFTLPIWYNLVYYFVQPSRYYIIAVTGCLPVVDASWVSVVLVFIPTPILTIYTGYYSCLVMWRMKKYRKEFSAILKNSRSNTSKSRFVRLFLVSIVMSIIFVSLNLFTFVFDMLVPRHEYSYSAIHNKEWWVILRLEEQKASVVLRWWNVAGAFLTFFFFGIGSESMAMYKSVAKKMGIDGYLPTWCCTSRTKTRTSTTTQSGSGSAWTYRSYFKSSRKESSITNSNLSNTLHSQHSDRKSVVGEVLPVAIVNSIPATIAETNDIPSTQPTVLSKLSNYFVSRFPFARRSQPQSHIDLVNDSSSNGDTLSKIHIAHHFEVTKGNMPSRGQKYQQEQRPSDEIPLDNIRQVDERDLESRGSEVTQVPSRG